MICPHVYITGFPVQFPGEFSGGKIGRAKKLIVTRVTRVIGPEGTPAPPRNKGTETQWFSKKPIEKFNIWLFP